MAVRKKRVHDSQAKSNLAEHKILSPTFMWVVMVIIFCGIPFSIGKYCEFNSPGPFDSSAYVYSAHHVLDGAKIGVDESPSAHMGTLLVNMLGVKFWGYSATGPKIIQTLMQLLALFCMLFTLRNLYGRTASVIATAIAAIYLSSPLIAKYGNVKEQYMIAVMIIGICCLIKSQLSNKPYWAMMAGGVLIWAPLFKPTGLSAIAGAAAFMILQPFCGYTSFKKAFCDIGLMVMGGAISVFPLYLWLILCHDGHGLPFGFIWTIFLNAFGYIGQIFSHSVNHANPAKGILSGGYVGEAKKMISFSTQFERVMRYYGLVLLPILLSVVSIIVFFIRKVFARRLKWNAIRPDGENFVLLFAVWWLVDMAFVWISPRSYEQYYLPLNASAAMLSGYIFFLFVSGYERAEPRNRNRWRAAAFVGLCVLCAMTWHIFFGITTSPYSGREYKTPTKGFKQTLEKISRIKNNHYLYPWQKLGDYIRENSSSEDTMYVWGWFPGFYVRAQRMSAATKACSMPRPSPSSFRGLIKGLIGQFKINQPQFIVDARKRHIPVERPPYELWPIMPKGFMGITKNAFLPKDERIISAYEHQWKDMLEKKFGSDEAERFEILKPLRDYIMDNYKIVNVFGNHVLFEIEKK